MSWNFWFCMHTLQPLSHNLWLKLVTSNKSTCKFWCTDIGMAASWISTKGIAARSNGAVCHCCCCCGLKCICEFIFVYLLWFICNLKSILERIKATWILTVNWNLFRKSLSVTNLTWQLGAYRIQTSDSQTNDHTYLALHKCWRH